MFFYVKIVLDRIVKMKKKKLFLSILSFVVAFVAYFYQEEINLFLEKITGNYVSYGLEEVPEYSGKSYVIINDNEPDFSNFDYEDLSEQYSELDSLGRAGVALAKISIDTMPREERGSIGSIKPTGWHTVKYDIVDGKYLYNRCHLIGYQLTGENANAKNLITCTREMNTGAMLDFENQVSDYVKETNNSVLYRVTPIYNGNNLLASGVTIEAKSLEDNGSGIKFYVYIYNVQEEITIDYKTGESSLTK